MSAELGVIGLGRMAYGEALELQRALAQQRIDRTAPRDLLLLVEHPPVVTLGRGSRPEHFSTPPEFLRAKGVELFEIERGGDVTFHGPGQLVGYPIFDLGEHQKDLHWFLRQLEEALIVALRELGIAAERRAGYTGVWTAGRKIASIGIHVKQWVTWHGFALNVSTDLEAFRRMIPCGFPHEVASMALLGVSASVREVGERCASALAERLGRRLAWDDELDPATDDEIPGDAPVRRAVDLSREPVLA